VGRESELAIGIDLMTLFLFGVLVMLTIPALLFLRRQPAQGDS